MWEMMTQYIQCWTTRERWGLRTSSAELHVRDEDSEHPVLNYTWEMRTQYIQSWTTRERWGLVHSVLKQKSSPLSSICSAFFYLYFEQQTSLSTWNCSGTSKIEWLQSRTADMKLQQNRKTNVDCREIRSLNTLFIAAVARTVNFKIWKPWSCTLNRPSSITLNT